MRRYPKLTAAALIAVLASSPAFAQSRSMSNAFTASASHAYAGNNIGPTIVTGSGNSNYPYRRGCFAPSPLGSPNTCLKSTSFGISGPGGGLTFGTTPEDGPCNARSDAVLFTNMAVHMKGRAKAVMHAAAIASMCTDPRMNAALTVAGYACALAPVTSFMGETGFQSPNRHN